MEPPPPPDLKDLAAKGAKFFYNGKAINSSRALRLPRNNTPLNIDVKQTNNMLIVYIEDSLIIEEQLDQIVPSPPKSPKTKNNNR